MRIFTFNVNRSAFTGQSFFISGYIKVFIKQCMGVAACNGIIECAALNNRIVSVNVDCTTLLDGAAFCEIGSQNISVEALIDVNRTTILCICQVESGLVDSGVVA